MEQAVACTHVTQGAWVRSPVGTGFLGEVFRGFSSRVRQMTGNLRPLRSPITIWPSQSLFHIRLVSMKGSVNGVYRLSCSCCVGDGPGIELTPHPERPFMSLYGHKSMYVIQRQFLLPTGRDSLRSGRREARNCNYKGEVKLG